MQISATEGCIKVRCSESTQYHGESTGELLSRAAKWTGGILCLLGTVPEVVGGVGLYGYTNSSMNETVSDTDIRMGFFVIGGGFGLQILGAALFIGAHAYDKCCGGASEIVALQKNDAEFTGTDEIPSSYDELNVTATATSASLTSYSETDMLVRGKKIDAYDDSKSRAEL